MPKILIVEDDVEIAMLERDYLEIEGFETQTVSDGETAVAAALTGGFDLLLLDLMLPGCNGYDVCRRIRDRVDIPILMVTARTDSVDKIRGLGLGADDYIAKPFDPAELVARVKAHLSRYARLTGAAVKKPPETQVLTVGDVQIFPQSWKVFKAGREIKMPNREFLLLKFLAENPNIVFSKERLFETIWGFDYVGDSATVTVHIGRIREKIEDDPARPKLIETVWGPATGSTHKKLRPSFPTDGAFYGSFHARPVRGLPERRRPRAVPTRAGRTQPRPCPARGRAPSRSDTAAGRTFRSRRV